MTSIYILKLTGGRYYVGKSSDPMKRYQEHLSGKGSAWTRKYKPIAVEKVISNASDFDEDKYTKIYMSKYGIRKVRGGAYVSEELEDYQEETLRNEIWGAQNKCTRCGFGGHFVKDCHATKDVEENRFEEEIWVCEKCFREFKSESACEQHENNCSKPKNRCFRCGRIGHYADDCYASTTNNGRMLWGKPPSYKKRYVDSDDGSDLDSDDYEDLDY
jgi:hypothetical protein